MAILRHIFKEKVNGQTVAISGLEAHEPDTRDFRYRDLGGWFDYKPKQQRLVLSPLEIKDQAPNNTCVFHSYAACREVQEGVPLSPRSLVAYAKTKGYLRSDGISSIRNGQKAGIEFGVAEESVVPNDRLSWSQYSNVPILGSVQASAAKHKAKSTFWVNDKNEWLKALDDGYAIHTGFDWYSSYNMTGGLRAPWILPWRKGWKVGGHAVACIGYDIPKGLYVFQNSFGDGWGDNGLFYLRMADVHREGMEGACAVDLDGDNLAAFIAAHEGKDIKMPSEPAIYRVVDGKKRAYPNECVFYAWGGMFWGEGAPTYQDVAGTLLKLIPDGDPMRAEESTDWAALAGVWDQVCAMKYPDNIDRIHAIIKSR